MDLNMPNKLCKTIINTRNSDFQKIAGDFPYYVRHTLHPSSQSLFYYSKTASRNPYPIYSALHTNRTSLHVARGTANLI